LAGAVERGNVAVALDTPVHAPRLDDLGRSAPLLLAVRLPLRSPAARMAEADEECPVAVHGDVRVSSSGPGHCGVTPSARYCLPRGYHAHSIGLDLHRVAVAQGGQGIGLQHRERNAAAGQAPALRRVRFLRRDEQGAGALE